MSALCCLVFIQQGQACWTPAEPNRRTHIRLKALVSEFTAACLIPAARSEKIVKPHQKSRLVANMGVSSDRGAPSDPKAYLRIEAGP